MNLQEKRAESIGRILNAATEIFAEQGFAGARVDEIAKRAGVNKAMIYYRLGDKEALYSEVLHNVFGDVVDRISRDIEDDQSPEEKLKTYIRNFINSMDRYPHLPYMMMREIASGGKHFTEIVAKDLISIMRILGKIITEGIEKGLFIKIDLLVLHMMIVAPLVFYRSSEPIRSMFLPLAKGSIDYSGLKGHEEATREIEKLILRAIKV